MSEPICECNTGIACPVPSHWQEHPLCDHDCAVVVSDEDYQRSEGVCAGCGVRMKNDAETGWAAIPPARSRDDAEKAIAGLLGEHAFVQRMTPMGDPFRMWWECACGQGVTDHNAHVASVIAGYMADVWDEGWNAHARGQVTEARFDPYQWNKNPYRDEGNQP